MALMNKEEILQILKIVSESTLDEVHLESGDLKLTLKRHAKIEPSSGVEAASAPMAKAPVTEKRPQPPPDQKEAMPAVPKPLPRKEEVVPEGFAAIRAPMLGTFYRAPKPEAPPFVKEGQLVSENDDVCIIEVMKLFSTIKAGVRGCVSKICAENAQLVEYNQVLFLIEETSEGAKREPTA